MTIMGESFLADLDELSDEDDVLKSPVGFLQKPQRYIDMMEKSSSLSEMAVDENGNDNDNDNEYKLIMESVALVKEIEDEIVGIYNFVREKYRQKFAELEKMVEDPIEYVQVVKKIGNEIDTSVAVVGVEEILPSHKILPIVLTGSTINGKPIAQDVLREALDACDRAIELNLERQKTLNLMETRMSRVAPNLSAVVGSKVAAKLVSIAGGLAQLARIPACDILLLGGGGNKRNTTNLGFSSQPHSRVGCIRETEICQSTPTGHRMFAIHQLAAKVALAVRIDSARGDPTGNKGRELCAEIKRKIDKRQEAPPPRIPKPLPLPPQANKKKRGGRRLRKAKERYGVTNMSKLSNRMQFGVPVLSSLGDGYGVGYGMLGSSSSQLRLSCAPTKLPLKPPNKKFKPCYATSSVAARIQGTSSSCLSSLAFTPVQGLLLPSQAHPPTPTRSSYFS